MRRTDGGRDLLVILDQFEEYFLYHPQDEAAGSFAELSRARSSAGRPAASLPDLDPRGRARASSTASRGRSRTSSTTTCASTTSTGTRRARRSSSRSRSTTRRAAADDAVEIEEPALVETRARRGRGRASRARRRRCGARSTARRRDGRRADRDAVPPARPDAPVGRGDARAARACCASRRSSASAARNGSSARTSTRRSRALTPAEQEVAARRLPLPRHAVGHEDRASGSTTSPSTPGNRRPRVAPVLGRLAAATRASSGPSGERRLRDLPRRARRGDPRLATALPAGTRAVCARAPAAPAVATGDRGPRADLRGGCRGRDRSVARPRQPDDSRPAPERSPAARTCAPERACRTSARSTPGTRPRSRASPSTRTASSR